MSLARHSGAAQSAEPGISRYNFEIPGSRSARPGMTFSHFFVLPESFTASKVANSTL
jgi:hypothetical protein